MNYIITQQCNKHCSYCFANSSREDNKHMDFEFYKKVIDESKSNIKLLGGEPTEHPDFFKFLEYGLIKNHVTIVSNFLFKDNIKFLYDGCIRCIGKKVRL